MELAKEIIQTIGGLATAIVAVLGILLAYKTHQLSKQQSEESKQEARSERFTRTIEHLKDESIAIRMGALFELEKMSEGYEHDKKNIVEILAVFVREHIEGKKHLIRPNNEGKDNWLPEPREDVYLAARILSDLFKRNNDLSAYLFHLDAKDLYLGRLELYGAKLYKASFRGARLHHTNLQYANLSKADFFEATFYDTSLKGADLSGANLLQARHLTAAQLLEARIDDNTLLDPDLRMEYERLKSK